MELVRRLVLRAAGPVVLDADGLNAFAGAAETLKDVSHPLILTPHIGEFSRLTGLEKEKILKDPMGLAGQLRAPGELPLFSKELPR